MKNFFQFFPDATTADTKFTDLTKGGTDSEKVNKFVPTDESNIVISMQEFPSNLTDFSNYSFLNEVPHNTVSKTLREWDAIEFIVLHETSEDSGKGFQMPYTAHFVVLNDGKIYQFNDLSEIEYHEALFNNAGIGIEFVNSDWSTGNGVAKDSDQSKQLKEDDNFIWAYWGDGYNIYKIPSEDRVERLAQLVIRLLQHSEEGFIVVNPDWLQLISYNDIKDIWDFADADIPASDDEKDKKKFFIFSNAIEYMLPEKHSSGILSHNSVSSLITVKDGDGNDIIVVDEDAHTDGSFQSLFTWLRIGQNFSSDDAYTNAKSLLRNNMFKATTKTAYEGYHTDKVTKLKVPYSGSQRRTIHLVDVSSI